MSKGKRAAPTWRSCERKEFICLGRRRLLLERWGGGGEPLIAGDLRRSRGKRAARTRRSCERKEFICLGRRRLLLERWVGTSARRDLRRRERGLNLPGGAVRGRSSSAWAEGGSCWRGGEDI